MAGIVLVTKPPCIFGSAEVAPSDDIAVNSTFISLMVNDYLNRDFEVFELSKQTPAAATEAADDGSSSLYMVGALIALSSAMFTAGYSCIMSKLASTVESSVQLLYIGIFILPLSTVCQLFEEIGVNNRFFHGSFTDITFQDWLAVVGVSLSGLLCIYTEIGALQIVPPAVFATLRTSQIIVAFIAQCIMNAAMPAVIDVAGAGLVFASAMAITFEPRLSKMIACR